MYQVHVVPDDQLPRGIRRVLVQRSDGDPLLILSETAAATWVRPTRLDPQVFADESDSMLLREVVNGG